MTNSHDNNLPMPTNLRRDAAYYREVLKAALGCNVFGPALKSMASLFGGPFGSTTTESDASLSRIRQQRQKAEKLIDMLENLPPNRQNPLQPYREFQKVPDQPQAAARSGQQQPVVPHGGKQWRPSLSGAGSTLSISAQRMVNSLADPMAKFTHDLNKWGQIERKNQEITEEATQSYRRWIETLKKNASDIRPRR